MKHLRLMQGPLILINHIPGSDIQSLLRYVQSRAAERVPFVAFKSLPPWVLQPNAIICLLSSEMGVFMSASSDFYLPGFLFIMMGLFFLGDSRIFNFWSCLCILFDNLSFFWGTPVGVFRFVANMLPIMYAVKSMEEEKIKCNAQLNQDPGGTNV